MGRIFCDNIVQYLAAVTGAFSQLSFGINNGWSSPYLPYLTSNSSIIPTTSDEGSWCAISPLLGSGLGALSAAYLADKIGRKYTVLLTAPMVFFSFIGIGLARHIWVLFALRFLIGITDGILYAVLPMYIGEISDPKIRGFLSTTVCFFFKLGVLFINVIGPLTDIYTSSLICAMIPALHSLTFTFMPESPYYYVKKKNYEKAKESLRVFKGSKNVNKEFNAICEGVKQQEQLVNKPKLLDLIRVPSYKRACIIVTTLILTSKLSGKIPVLVYTKTIFQETGSSIDANISTIIYCCSEIVVMSFTSYFIVDRFGKRFLIIISATGCATSMLSMSIYFYLKDYHGSVIEYLNWLPIIALVSYNIMYSMGLSFGSVAYLSELFPTNVKANALSIAACSVVIVGAITSKFFQAINDATGTMCVSFFCFSVFTYVGLFFIVKTVPELKGKTLEEIQTFLITKKSRRCDAEKETIVFVDEQSSERT